MSYENFKPTIWSKHIQRELRSETIFADYCWKQFEGEARMGKEVKILGVGKPTITKYVPGVAMSAAEKVADTSVFMRIDQFDSFNFSIDDVDEAQSVPGLMEILLSEAKDELALSADAYIATMAQYGGTVTNSAQFTTSAGVKTAVDLGIGALRDNHVKIADNVVMEIPWFMYQLLKDKYIELDTNNSEMLKRGIVGMYDGVKVRPTANLYTNGTDYYAMIRTDRAIAYADGINKVEAYRPDLAFEDAIKGLYIYGAKVVRPKELYTIKCHK